MSGRRRVTAAYVASLDAALSDRDRSIVSSLDLVRVASSDQLARLHFAQLTNSSGVRQSNKTLARLVDLRILSRLPRRLGGPRSGSTPYVYALDVAGQRLASACGPAGGARLRRPWTPGHQFLAHSLAVTEAYVRLTELAQRGRLELLDFQAEPLCWRRFAATGGARATLKPDAWFRLGLGSFEDSYFLEVDRATQSGPAISRKLTTYRRYFASGREQARYGVFPTVLVLAPTEARRTFLTEVAASQPADAARLWRIERFDALADVACGEGA